MRQKVVWGPVVFAGLFGARVLGIAEQIVVFGLMLLLIGTGYMETISPCS
jgi:hypothetical protein